jgi:hypothetical protein
MYRKNRESIALVLAALGLAGILSSHMFPVEEQPVVNAASAAHTLTIDVAADCRTFVPVTNRGDTIMVSGKIFPGGTLPIGSGDNDPTLPVDGVRANRRVAQPHAAKLSRSHPRSPRRIVQYLQLLATSTTSLTTGDR